MVEIRNVHDKVDILQSMQKPRKIQLYGSDGQYYPFLVKPTDDLRRDCRLMELGEIVNARLKKDPESCRRRLYMRTYVIGLNFIAQNATTVHCVVFLVIFMIFWCRESYH